MSFDNVIGQERIKEILRRAIRGGRLAHAYLFHGPEGVGKDALALELAKALNCLQGDEDGCDQCPSCRKVASFQHPDIKFIFPIPSRVRETELREKIQQKAQDPYRPIQFSLSPSISIERIRELRREATLKPFEGRWRVIIISEADKMTQEASNALLKILEEPSERMLFLLTTSRLDHLLPTIVSRCQNLRFDRLKTREVEQGLLKRGVPPEKAGLVARLSMGSFKKALELLQEDINTRRQEALKFLQTGLEGSISDRLNLVERLVAEKDRERIKDMLNLLLLWLRDLVLAGELRGEELLNLDRAEQILSLARRYEKVDWGKAILEVEKSIDLANKNIYINLVLIALLNNLKRLCTTS